MDPALVFPHRIASHRSFRTSYVVVNVDARVYRYNRTFALFLCI